MAKGQLFEYAVLHHPKATKEQADRNETPKSVVIVPLTSVMAGTQQEVQITAGRARFLPSTSIISMTWRFSSALF